MFHCGEMGYFSSNCPKKEKEREKKKGKQATFLANKVENDELTRRLEEEEEYITIISHFSQGTIREDGWYVESGVTKHMTGSQDLFEALVEWDSKLHMVLGNKSQLEIRGSGVVPFRMERGRMMQV